MATSLDVFSSYVLPFVPSCPDSMVRQYVLEAAIELCERSGVWQDDLPLAAVGGGLFSPVLPTGARVLLISAVNRTPTVPVPETSFSVSGDWTRIVFPEQQLADIAETFTVTAKLAPTRLTLGQPTAELPDVLVERFLMGIAAGAKHKLMNVPGQPWTNPDSAASFEAEFNLACGTAAAEIFHQRRTSSPRVQYRAFR